MSSKPKNTQSKKDSKARSNKKSSYLADDSNFGPFSAQLAKLGLVIRDVGGDGNCCFRALSDQLFGNENEHLDIRQRTCQYMRQHRDEFQPFIAALADQEEVGKKASEAKKTNKKSDSFDTYMKALEMQGTYADNASLVAFARLYQSDILIHQYEMDIWTITGGAQVKKGQSRRQFHLAYHNGEHYSSVRMQADGANVATNFRSEYKKAATGNSTNKSKNYCKSSGAASYYEEDDEDDMRDLNMDQIMNVTNCTNVELISQKLLMNNNDVEATIVELLAGVKINESDSENEDPTKASSKLSNKKNPSNKKDKKRDKKNRQMERQIIRVLEQREHEQTKTSKLSSAAAGVEQNCSESPEADPNLLGSMEIKLI